MLRKVVVSGRFYPPQPKLLHKNLADYLGPPQCKRQVRGVVVPHAGYFYSGHVAGAVFSRIEIPSRIIILCPNHTGLGPSLSIIHRGQWKIPLGKITIDTNLAKRLIHYCPLLTKDSEAHRFDHSLEVQLPFLFHLRRDFHFVPIALGRQDYSIFEHLGKGIASTLRELPDQQVLIVASSDMNHFDPNHLTRIKDQKAIAKISALHARGLYQVLKAESISMCGYGPTIAMLHGTEATPGTNQAEFIKYPTSADVGGDKNKVVGYAGITIQ